MDISELLDDLADEVTALAGVAETLTDDEWNAPTASPRWSSLDQLAHLTFFDGTALLAISDPAAFLVHRDELFTAAMTGDEHYDDYANGALVARGPRDLLSHWRTQNAELITGLAAATDGTRVEWYGPSMSVASFTTARLMETWAHGTDIVDVAAQFRNVAAETLRPPTDRLRHVAQLGWITRSWSFVNRGLPAPTDPVRLELEAPSGVWHEWGPAGAPSSVRGSMYDFCLLVTQRRRAADLRLEVVGDAAVEWMAHAQAFAGPATDGPQ